MFKNNRMILPFVICLFLAALIFANALPVMGSYLLQGSLNQKQFIPIVIAPDNTPVNSFVIDHNSTSLFSSIPTNYLQAAASKRLFFPHRSTGNYIYGEGLMCIAGLKNDPYSDLQECLNYANLTNNPYNISKWSWPYFNTTVSAVDKMTEFNNTVRSSSSSYDVFGMKFCYIDGYDQNFQMYKDMMNNLEATYPSKKFIWVTQALWAKSHLDSSNTDDQSALDIQAFNQQLRTYARANNKILFDLADIESHAANGSFCQSSGVEAMCNEYYSGDGGGHPSQTASIKFAKAFWVVMARLSGWSGN